MKTVQFEYRPPLKMTIAWTFAAVCCFALALLPWLVIMKQPGGIPIKLGLLVLVAWSSFPTTLGAWLVYSAYCKTSLIGEKGVIHRDITIFGWTRMRKFRFDRAFFVKLRSHGGKTDKRDYLTVFLRCDAKKVILASQLSCSRIVELAEWIEKSTGLKCSVMRRRIVRGHI